MHIQTYYLFGFIGPLRLKALSYFMKGAALENSWWHESVTLNPRRITEVL